MIPKPSTAISNGINWFKTTRDAGAIPFWIVFVIAIYTPFEEFLIKWLPATVGGLMRFFPEVILYGLMLQILRRRFFNTRNLKATPIDLLLVLFFISTAISMAVNGSDLVASLINLRSLWRYLSVFYVLVNVEVSASQVGLIVRGVRNIGIIEAGLATLQLILPAGFASIFAPRQISIGSYERATQAETGDLKVGSVFGTFGTPAVLSTFLMVALIIAISYFFTAPNVLMVKLKELSGIGVLFAGLFGTKKRASRYRFGVAA